MFLKVLEHKIIAIDFQLNALEHLDAETKRSERVPKKQMQRLKFLRLKLLSQYPIRALLL